MEIAEDQVKPEGETRPEVSEVESAAVETQPTPPEEQKVPLKELAKQREKKRAEAERADRAERELQALKLQMQQQAAPKEVSEEAEVLPPHPDDFIEHDEWIAANKKFLDHNKTKILKEAEQLAAQTVQNHQLTQQQQAEQLAAQQAAQAARDAYLDRAEKLNAPDFLEAEEKLLTKWSPEFMNMVISGVPNSEQVIYQLGNDLEKAEEIARKIDENGFSGGYELLQYAAQLGQRTTAVDLPEPDEPITGGAGGVQDVEAKIARLREKKLKGEMSQTELLAQIRELKGWKAA